MLGISCYYHDSAAALIEDGEIVAAAQEERFTRKKHDDGFPSNAVRYCLAEGAARNASGLDAVVFYDKPLLKFHRILETYLTVAPRGLASFLQAIPLWLKEKLWIPPHIQESLADCGIEGEVPIRFAQHHESHAASAYYPSPFPEAAVLTLDGVGEWATTTIGVGEGEKLSLLREIRFPHSLGLLYSAFTYFTGFKVNSGEYKLMGLAPYGEGIYADVIRRELIDLRDDGSFRLNMEYFGYLDGLAMTNDRFAKLFGGPARAPESRITRREMDLARSIQDVTEEVVLRLARHTRELTGKRNLCLAGGVALNCVANGVLLRTGIFDDLWIQPAAGDAGGALGAALAYYHNALGRPRPARVPGRDGMKAALLGPEFTREQIRAFLLERDLPHEELADAEWAPRIAEVLAGENIVGLLQGRMEFGPRALGARSIIGDARSPKMQSVMNLKIKYRESFRPFAPSVLEERVSDYFELDRPSPYMLLVAPVRADRRTEKQGDERSENLLEWVNRIRSDIPAVTHVDDSARIQTVDAETNPRYHALIAEFEKRTGYGVIVNTSFNVRGEPIVCTPEDAYRCFMRTEMDYLVLGPFLLAKSAQPKFEDAGDWRQEFQLD
ncbi:MAG TPA: carbamoyltransferase [Thermoanaerobaculia bacterium]|nr:carbamoyltransferase [Thermoanaerobaculia bacterium]